MVSATTMDSITWTWNAVEGALGYAVQVSHDEMFDDTDMTHPTTETTFTASDLEPETSVFVRVRAAAGTVEAPLVSAWTTHVTGMSAMPPPPPPAPMAAPTPTGLMSEPGDGSITWSWEAVDGADGYAVQVSMDEMFDDMDETTYTMETSHMIEDLGYSETRFARVASTSGEGDDMLMSMWTTHVTGMSMAEPPPPPPAAVSATFSLAKGHYLVADNGRNAATAMATVNPKIMVESNTSAVITPMFVDGANGVSISAGSDNMPFALVDWELLQADVLSDGATFMIERTMMGANQEMMPTGHMAYVTCGPFECSESSNDGPPPVPEPSIANSTVCSAFAPDVSMQVGFVDNDGVKVTAADYTPGADGTIANDGIDVGWVTTSEVDMTVKHHFSGVANGENFVVTGRDAFDGTSEPLSMTNHVQGTTPAAAAVINDADFKGALLVGTLDGTGDNTGLDPCASAPRYSDPRSGLHKPDSCFRVTSAGDAKSGTNYLGGYSIELAAKNAGVSWGKVAWDPDPFKDLKCESEVFMATDEMEADVCELFEDEVDRAIAKKWGGSRGTTVMFLTGNSSTARPDREDYAVLPNTATDDTRHLVALRIPAPNAESRRFASLWYSDNDKLAESKNKSEHDMYATTGADPLHVELVDEDGDPKYGDFGKVDFTKPDGTDSGTDHDFGEDYRAESAAGGESSCSHSDGEGCDGMLEETITVNFDAGLAMGCSVEREVSISCTWDANGEMSGYRADDHHGSVTRGADASTASTFSGFVATPASGARAAGAIGAFVKCTVSG